eukprot:Seg1363.23 transcript_id=Seg1363.23/GoldUCD/mRNA.D3Y31 product="hypothetical protein" protein_id=Seg1363.23/GoldUCD/D3Y31
MTRGENLDSVINNQLWWNGPGWLKKDDVEWLENKLDVSPESKTEIVKNTVCNHSTIKSVSIVIDPAKYEKFLKLARITAYVLRAVRNFKKSLRSKATSQQQTESSGKELTTDEIKSAEEYWYRQVQQEEFPDDFEALKNSVQLPKSSQLNSLFPIFDHEKELIKVGGRLQFSLIPEESKHQIILPGKHMVVEKIIQSAHEREGTHAGPETTLAITRERFWIIQGRRNVTRVIHRCLKCKRQVTKQLMQKMAPLPVERNKNGVSLNDCLLPGPVLQPNLVSIIIRFRLHRVALMADIRKMFLQIKLAKQDQSVHRFMWRDFITKIEPKTYCMTRITCGDVSSPFEAIATVQHHAEVNKESFPEASETIKENMYVDDCLTGAEDDKSAFQLYEEATGMMKSGGFEVVKWASNSKDVLVRIPKDQRATKNVIEIESEGDPLKVLGIS